MLSLVNNMAAMTAENNLSNASNAMNTSLQRLSSGLAINSGADNPAGMVISQEQMAQMSGLQTAITNTSNDVNVVQIADGALNETNTLLLQIRGLAVDAANAGANNPNSLAADQAQISNALSTITSIANSTQYGSNQLLTGTYAATATTNNTNATASGATVPPGTYNVAVTSAATAAQVTGGTYTAPSSAESVTIDGTAVNINAGDTIDQAVSAINGTAGIDVTASKNSAGTGINLTSNSWGSGHTISVSTSAGTADTTGLDPSKSSPATTNNTNATAASGNATAGTYNVAVTTAAQAAHIVGGTFTAPTANETLDIGGTSVSLTSSNADTLADAIKTINGTAGIGVTASQNSAGTGIILTSNSWGSGHTISVSTTAGTDTTGLDPADNSASTNNTNATAAGGSVAPGTYNAAVTTSATAAHVIGSAFTAPTANETLKINGVSVNLTSTNADTIGDAINTINGASGTGVTASQVGSGASAAIVLTSNAWGTGHAITVQTTAGTDKTGLDSANNSASTNNINATATAGGVAPGTYNVAVTTAATAAHNIGTAFTAPTANETLDIGGTSVNLTSSNADNITDAINTINGTTGIGVTASQNGAGTAIILTSKTWGSSVSNISVTTTSGTDSTGLSGSSTVAGTDIAGTVNGVAATGAGNVLTDANGLAVTFAAGSADPYTSDNTATTVTVTGTSSVDGTNIAGTINGVAATGAGNVLTDASSGLAVTFAAGSTDPYTSDNTATKITVTGASSADGANIVGTINGVAATGTGNVLSNASGLAVTFAAGSANPYTSDNTATAVTVTSNNADGTDIAGTINGVAATGTGNVLTATSGEALGLSVTFAASSANPDTSDATATTVSVSGNNGLVFQIGANAGQTASLSIGSMIASSLGQGVSSTFANLSQIDVTKAGAANDVLTVVDQAINQVATESGQLGAFQDNTLQATAANLQTSLQNTTAANSTIRDTDFATETANYAQDQVLVQAGTQVLKNASQIPSLVLTLLQ